MSGPGGQGTKKKPVWKAPPGWRCQVLMMNKTGFPSIEAHHRNVRRVPCVVSGRSDVTLHHVHGRAVGRRLLEMGMDPVKGLARRGYSDALVIPLALEFHSYGPYAIDGQMGVESWEGRFGSQVDHVDAVSALVGYSLWEMHRALMSRRSKSRYWPGYEEPRRESKSKA